MSNSLLVTGGAGFIGSNFVHYWMNKYPSDNIIVLDVLTYAGSEENLSALRQNPNFKFIKGDICNQPLIEELLSAHSIDRVVHFAAESHVDRSITGPDAFIETNILGTYALLKASLKYWTANTMMDRALFHHVSTDEVFGSLSPTDPAFSETTPYAPNSPYSASKAASDHLVRAYHHTYKLPVTTSNCSNNYGPYQFPEKLIPLMITNVLEGKSLPIYGDGLNIRDWLYVDDHCRGIELVMQRGRHGETYNIGGINEMTNKDLVFRLCDVMDDMVRNNELLKARFPNCPASNGKSAHDLIIYVQDRAGHDRRYAIDPTKCRDELGYKPAETFETAFRKTVEWYLANEQWWRTQQQKKAA
jgi:dTDP-glucose 4,6-dehydratase